MKKVETVKKLTGGRYLVVMEDGSSFPLYGRELEEFHIQEESELTDDQLDAIMTEVLPKRVKLCAMHILEKTDKTERQLYEKLAALSYPEELIHMAIAYVKKYHYVDDLRYAVSYMEYRRENKSIRQMEQELYQKGISGAVFQEALEQIEKPDEEHQIMAWLQKKHYNPDTADAKEQNRICAFLLRRGYQASAIQRMVRKRDSYE